MKRLDYRLVFGVLLVLAGVVFMLETLNVLEGAGSLFWSLVFGVAGAAFLYVFLTDREQWWAIIPGFALLGLAAIIAIETLPLGDTGDISGAVFLGSIGIAFWIVYFMKRDFWWALIPGGVMITLALVAGLSGVASGDAGGGIFFLGLAATFGSLYYIPTAQGRQKWAAIPALILGAMGLLLLANAVTNLSLVLPVALVVVGAYLLWRALVPRKGA